MYADLHTRSWFSFRAGASAPEAIVAQAASLGVEALAITDLHGTYAAVRFQEACKAVGVKPIFGAEVCVEGGFLVLLAADRERYGNLCRLISLAHYRDREAPEATFAELERCGEGLFCLTGTRGGTLWRLLDAKEEAEAAGWVRRLEAVFGARLSIEMAHHSLRGDGKRLRKLAALSRETGVPLVATSNALYARPEDYELYDVMVCSREGASVLGLRHPARPRNDRAHLKSRRELLEGIPYPDAFRRAEVIARACDVDLLPGHVTPPAARLPEGVSAKEHLLDLCRNGLKRRYAREEWPAAAAQLKKELDTVLHLGLEEFFLVVWEVVQEAKDRGIRVDGRGSAAGSIISYVLGISNVDPLAYNLLFERFLHKGRRGTPDIDIDVDTERRHELIHWMEGRFTPSHTAMAATVVTYGLRSALRDVAKALGCDQDMVNALGKAVPHRSARSAPEYRAQIEEVLGASPLVDLLIRLVVRLEGCPRHLGQHSGGMVLSRVPLRYFTPVQPSANGILTVQFDKDDLEKLGLTKLDVLGLRMFSTIVTAVDLIRRHQDPGFDPDRIPLDDTRTFNLIRASNTLTVFQLESPGQRALLARTQPVWFRDLVVQIALFRPGPIQSNMVGPFVRRLLGWEHVTYPDPDLEPVLRDTLGIPLFQEHILMIAHVYAGMSLLEADRFRELMSKCRDAAQMEAMRGRFVEGAMGRGKTEIAANKMFDVVAAYVGYGFCRAHAASFARSVYLSCYLKAHYPAAYMAAAMEHRPGMYPLGTLEQEARRMGARVLPPSINQSNVGYDLERDRRGRLCIRKSLASVAQLSEEDARAIVWERLSGSYRSLEDLYARVTLSYDVLHNLARSGALDELCGDSRTAVYRLRLLRDRLGKPGRRPLLALFEMPALTAEDVVELPRLEDWERIEWDYQTHGAGRVHPMTLHRRRLCQLEIRPLGSLWPLGRTARQGASRKPLVVTTAGICIARQKPPTAGGVMFLMLEDETADIQCVCRPEVLERLDEVLREGALVVRGELAVKGNWRGLVVTHAWKLEGAIGGFAGHPEEAGGQDSLIRTADAAHEENVTATLVLEAGRNVPGGFNYFVA